MCVIVDHSCQMFTARAKILSRIINVEGRLCRPYTRAPDKNTPEFCTKKQRITENALVFKVLHRMLLVAYEGTK